MRLRKAGDHWLSVNHITCVQIHDRPACGQSTLQLFSRISSPSCASTQFFRGLGRYGVGRTARQHGLVAQTRIPKKSRTILTTFPVFLNFWLLVFITALNEIRRRDGSPFGRRQRHRRSFHCNTADRNHLEDVSLRPQPDTLRTWS